MDQTVNPIPDRSTAIAALDKLKQTLLKLIIGGWIAYAIGMTVIALSSIPSQGVAKITFTGYLFGLFSFTAYASTRARTRPDMAIVGIVGTIVSVLALLMGILFIWVIADSASDPTTFAKASGISMIVALCLAHGINLAFLRPGHSLTNAFKYVTISATALFGVSLSYVLVDPENAVNFSFFGGMDLSIVVRLILISMALLLSGTICTVIFSKYLKAPPPPPAEEIDHFAAPGS